MNTISRPSPNYTKGRTKAVTTIVVHYTGSDSADSACSWFENKASKVSAHYVISKGGDVYKCVGTTDVAWHAGFSKGPNGLGVNKYSIGIELAGTGDKYPSMQLHALESLITELVKAIPTIEYLTGHDQICQPKGRKADPGPNFPLLHVSALCRLKAWYRGD